MHVLSPMCLLPTVLYYPENGASQTGELQFLLRTACRILTSTGPTPNVSDSASTGQLSLRRSHSPREQGVQLVAFDPSFSYILPSNHFLHVLTTVCFVPVSDPETA